MRRLSKAVAVRCCCCCVIVCGTLHVARVMRCYCCCCSRHNVAHTHVITTKILGDKKKRRTSPTKKGHVAHSTHDSRTLHVARTVGTLDCLRYRALLLLLLVLLLLLLLLLLCCFVLHTKRRRHTRWQSEREVLENASGPRRGLAPNAASTCFLVAKHFACAASQRRRRATAASSAAGASSDGEISSFSLIGSKKRHDAAARRHTHRHTWHTHT